MNIAIISENTVVNTAVFDDIETAQEFLGMDVWADIKADSVVELEDGYGIGDSYDNGIWEKAPPIEVEVDVDALRQSKLAANSQTCGQLIETAFMSDIKGDGLQPYRFNDDDQKNILGYNVMILFALGEDPTGENLPMFEWKNANEVLCTPTWHWTQIVGLFQSFGVWKEMILRRQDEIKVALMEAETAQELESVNMSYDDLTAFGGGEA